MIIHVPAVDARVSVCATDAEWKLDNRGSIKSLTHEWNVTIKACAWHRTKSVRDTVATKVLAAGRMHPPPCDTDPRRTRAALISSAGGAGTTPSVPPPLHAPHCALWSSPRLMPNTHRLTARHLLAESAFSLPRHVTRTSSRLLGRWLIRENGGSWGTSTCGKIEELRSASVPSELCQTGTVKHHHH